MEETKKVVSDFQREEVRTQNRLEIIDRIRDKIILSTMGLAKKLSVSTETIRRWAVEGKLPKPLGGQTQYTPRIIFGVPDKPHEPWFFDWEEVLEHLGVKLPDWVDKRRTYFLRAHQLAQRFGVSKPQISHWVKHGYLPEPVRPSSTVALFNWDLVLEKIVRRKDEERIELLRQAGGIDVEDAERLSKLQK